jgi:hypothetical protein
LQEIKQPCNPAERICRRFKKGAPVICLFYSFLEAKMYLLKSKCQKNHSRISAMKRVNTHAFDVIYRLQNNGYRVLFYAIVFFVYYSGLFLRYAKDPNLT